MTFNLDWIEKYYQSLPGKMAKLRQLVGRPLTYTEKILYAHLAGDMVEFKRGVDYVEFNPDRVAMQDATAQMFEPNHKKVINLKSISKGKFPISQYHVYNEEI